MLGEKYIYLFSCQEALTGKQTKLYWKELSFDVVYKTQKSVITLPNAEKAAWNKTEAITP